MNAAATRTFTVRFPEQLHRLAAETAAASGVSLNQLLQRAIEAYLRDEEARQLFDSYSRLGEDPSECDVEYAWAAQREAVDGAAV